MRHHPRPLARSFVTSAVTSVVVASALSGCGSTPPDLRAAEPGPPAPAASTPSAADHEVFDEAIARTQGASSGRFAVGMRGTGYGGELVETRLTGAFDHDRQALDLSLDVAALVAANPGLAAGVPAEAIGDVLQERVIGQESWRRGRSDGPWRLLSTAEGSISSMSSVGADELLALVAGASRKGVRSLAPGRFEGRISISELAIAGGDAELLQGIAATMPPEVDEAFFRFEAVVGAHGYLDQLLVEVDVAAVSAAVGEDDEGVRFGFYVEWSDLDQPVDIPRPTDVVTIALP